jgi:hypothetical protein
MRFQIGVEAGASGLKRGGSGLVFWVWLARLTYVGGSNRTGLRSGGESLSVKVDIGESGVRA